MRIKTLLLTALCLICTTPVFADFTDGDFTFSENGSTCTLIGYSGAGGDVTIPSVAIRVVVNDYIDYSDSIFYEVTVTAIGDDVFRECLSLTSVIIPDSVLEIGQWAFLGCTNLAEITIGNSVRTISRSAFNRCSSLTEVTIPNSVTEIIHLAFAYCYNLVDVTIGNSVETIGDWVFRDCTSLTSITIPESVTVFGNAVFMGCQALTAINVADGNMSWVSEDGVLYNKSKSLLHTCPGGKSGPFTIPSSVTEIVSDAFEGCSYLSSITIPNSVTTIGDRAFAGCYTLTAINVDEGNISWASEDGVLYNKNKSLLYFYPGGKSGPFTIPSFVTEIASYAFNSCIYLSSITIPNSVTDIGYNAFYNCISLTEVTIPNSVTVLEGGVFAFCTGLASVVIPNSITTIGINAFEGCTSLASIVIPNSVETIGHYAFHHCTSLASVTIPNSVTAIGWYAFEDCTGLRDITVSWPTPLDIHEWDDIFLYVDLSNCTLHVPAGTEDLYAAAEVWRDFNIVASSTTPDEPEDDNLMPTAVALNLNEVSLKAGETVQLSATVSPDDAINKEVIWESSDTEVATVSSTGLVTALSEGTATITVTTAYRSHTDECIVTVTKDDDDEGNDDSVEAVNSNKPEVNISNGILTVTSPATEQVEVYSLTGALLHKESKASGTATLNIGHLPKGILIVRGNSGWTQKIILK
ncbi:MAG: leucine-rich repeat protein [Tannerellaceae bacterium]|jgi:uncharacterized protein YjdB|nr:leucine-rich repeat protein [Tannerellaceae bacterium]